MCNDLRTTHKCGHVVRTQSWCRVFSSALNKNPNMTMEQCPRYTRSDDKSLFKCNFTGPQYCFMPGKRRDEHGNWVADYTLEEKHEKAVREAAEAKAEMEKKFEAMAVAEKERGPPEPFLLESHLIVTKPMAWDTEAVSTSRTAAEKSLQEGFQGMKRNVTTYSPDESKPMLQEQSNSRKKFSGTEPSGMSEPNTFVKPTFKTDNAESAIRIPSTSNRPFAWESQITNEGTSTLKTAAAGKPIGRTQEESKKEVSRKQFGRGRPTNFDKPAFNALVTSKTNNRQHKPRSQKKQAVHEVGRIRQKKLGKGEMKNQSYGTLVEDLIDLSGSEEIPVSNNTGITSDMEALRPIRLGEERRANNAEDSIDFENVAEKGLKVDDDNMEDVESVEKKQLEDDKQSNLKKFCGA